jgi:hypothetical protein
MTIIENGYDESAFEGAEQVGRAARGEAAHTAPIVLVHSGTIYESERDPRPFFRALAQLRDAGALRPGDLNVVLRASGHDEFLRGLIDELRIGDFVKLEPAIPYRAALAEMLTADGLLVLQAANCNYQVPAKLYEYLRARRPILALTDPPGDTAAVLRDAGIDTIAPLDSADEIARMLVRFLELVRHDRAPVAEEAKVAAASRRVRTMELARLLDTVAG